MNVLVYSGAGTTAESVKHCLHTLRRFLSPHYAVISVDAKVLKNEPWAEKTSLLVFPGGADLPFCREFNGEGNRKIKKFVKKGGRYIGFCAGAYYAASRLEFETGTEMEVSGSRELGFFPGTAKGTAFKGFRYGSNSGERAAKCSIEMQIEGFNVSYDSFISHYNGGPTFYDAEKFENVEILSKYQDPLDVDSGAAKLNAAVIYCKVGDGGAVLFGPHCEFDPTLLRFTIPKKSTELLDQLDAAALQRDYFLRLVFLKLGLKVNNIEDLKVPKLTPLILSSMSDTAVSQIISDIEKDIGYSDEEHTIINAPNDTFHVCRITDNETSTHIKMHDQNYEDPDSAVKELWVYENGDKPSNKITPYFSIRSYFSYLDDCWNEAHHRGTFGATLLYGEILTSTNTLLEKNYKVLSHLPDGFTAIGTTQVSGRGRGGNVWVSPMGTLSISTVVRLSIADSKIAPVVFVQYLTSMAMVEAVMSYGGNQESGYAEMPIRLKWPNDIYIQKPETIGQQTNAKYVYELDPVYVKIGGLLINTLVQDSSYVLVIGCGVNVSNAGPTTSLNLVLSKINEERKTRRLAPLAPFTVEKLAAKFMFCVEKLFLEFQIAGFKPLLPRYYKYWLHNNQIVTLGSVDNSKARITGISSDYGLLVVEKLNRDDSATGQFLELQPDGNSFDMFNGLITRKQAR